MDRIEQHILAAKIRAAAESKRGSFDGLGWALGILFCDSEPVLRELQGC
jgi:hypothetical protein